MSEGISPATVDQLRVNAQPLRFLGLAHQRSIVVNYKGYGIRVPEPEAFVLLKVLILPRRKVSTKRQKDIDTVTALGEFLTGRPDRRTKMIEIFRALPGGWQKRIRHTAEQTFPWMTSVLTS